MSVFFTSDLHFGHRRMMEMRNEWESFVPPVESVEAMDEWIVAMWNAVVTEADDVWVLGDVSFANAARTTELVTRLAGRKKLVPGNHDSDRVLRACKAAGWEIMPPIVDTQLNDRRLVLCHYPLMTWRNAHHGAWHLHGHSHGSLTGPETTRLDVGIDTHEHLQPYAWADLAGTLLRRSYGPIDHHKPHCADGE